MKSYVVLWADLYGRFRVKSYTYRRCCEKFAERILTEGRAENNDVRVCTFKGKRLAKTELSKNSTVPRGTVRRGGLR